jgi:chromosomal replication initiation ATPase DnaA
MQQIIDTVCKVQNISLADFNGSLNTRPFAFARHAAIYLCHEQGFSRKEIGEYMKRNRSVIHVGLKYIEDMKYRGWSMFMDKYNRALEAK